MLFILFRCRISSDEIAVIWIYGENQISAFEGEYSKCNETASYLCTYKILGCSDEAVSTKISHFFTQKNLIVGKQVKIFGYHLEMEVGKSGQENLIKVEGYGLANHKTTFTAICNLYIQPWFSKAAASRMWLYLLFS